MSICLTYCNKCKHIEPNMITETCVKCDSPDVDHDIEMEQDE